MVTTLSLLLQQIQDIEHSVSRIYKSNRVVLTKWENRLLRPTQIGFLNALLGEDLNHAFQGQDLQVSLILHFEITELVDPTPLCDFFSESPYIFIWMDSTEKDDKMYITNLIIAIC